MADLKTPEINTADETPKASEDAETRQVAGANDPPRKPLTRTSAVVQGAVIIFIGLAHAMGGVGATTLLAPFMQADLKISDSNLQWVSSSLTIPVVRSSAQIQQNSSSSSQNFVLESGKLVSRVR
jgi:hypothetical protein